MTPVERIYMMNEMKSSKTFGTVLQLAWRIFGMKPDLHSDQLRLRWMYKLKCGPTIRKYFVLLVMLCRCLANLGFVE